MSFNNAVYAIKECEDRKCQVCK